MNESAIDLHIAETIAEIDKTLLWINSLSSLRKVSNEGVLSVLRFTQLFESLPPIIRCEMRDSLTDKEARWLMCFDGILFKKAMLTKDVTWLRGALILHIIEDFREDYRENLRSIQYWKAQFQYSEMSMDMVLSEIISLAAPRGLLYFRANFFSLRSV